MHTSPSIGHRQVLLTQRPALHTALRRPSERQAKDQPDLQHDSATNASIRRFRQQREAS